MGMDGRRRERAVAWRNGRLHLAGAGDAPALSEDLGERLREAFERGAGHGSPPSPSPGPFLPLPRLGGDAAAGRALAEEGLSELFGIDIAEAPGGGDLSPARARSTSPTAPGGRGA